MWRWKALTRPRLHCEQPNFHRLWTTWLPEWASRSRSIEEGWRLCLARQMSDHRRGRHEGRLQVEIGQLTQRTPACIAGNPIQKQRRHKFTRRGEVKITSICQFSRWDLINRRTLSIGLPGEIGHVVDWCVASEVAVHTSYTGKVSIRMTLRPLAILDHNASRACNNNALQHLTSWRHVLRTGERSGSERSSLIKIQLFQDTVFFGRLKKN